MAERDFDQLLLKAIDDGLSTLGESPKQAIYFNLETKFNIRREEIPQEITAFTRAIEKIFGLGADFLKTAIMKKIHERIGGCFAWPESKNLTFNEYVAAAKQNYLNRRETEKTTGQMPKYVT